MGPPRRGNLHHQQCDRLPARGRERIAGFALVTFPALLRTAEAHPDIIVGAFADNAVIAGRWSQVGPAVDTLVQEYQAMQLTLNASESGVYIPNCSAGSDQVPQSFQTPGGLVIPVTTEGAKLMGAPKGTDEYCQRVLAN